MIQLTREERQNPFWSVIVEKVELRIKELQALLERPNQSHDDTQVTRGRLAELRGILIAGKDAPVQEPPIVEQF